MATQTRRNLLQRLWAFFSTGNQATADGSGLQGSQYPIGRRQRRSTTLPIPEHPVRPIMGDMSISQELIEMKTWSYEMRHAISILARDCFQQIDGSSASWFVPDVLPDGTKVHPDVLAIAKDLEARYNGKQRVIGGDRLQRAARDMLAYGDAFVELSIEKEGIGNRDYGIARSLYLPSLSIFVDEDDQEGILTYVQQKQPQRKPDDIEIHPLKVLQFSYEENKQYGEPLALQSLEPWRKIKAVSADLEDAARECAIAPWLHIMPSDKDEKYRSSYQQRHESLMNDGVVTNLYLLSGADVRRALGGSEALKPLLDYYLSLRYQMLPPGLPHYLFPGLGLESSSGKEIANQPALAYARTIANIRSLLGEQIKWAISIEIVLKKGFDFFEKEGRFFNVAWATWFTTGMESALLGRGDDQTPADRAMLNASLLLNEPQATDLPAIDAALINLNSIMTEGVSRSEFKRMFDLAVELRMIRNELRVIA